MIVPDKTNIAFLREFPNAEHIDDIYDALPIPATHHVFGAPAKQVFVAEQTEADTANLIIATPSSNPWQPMYWSLFTRPNNDAIPVFINADGRSCLYETEQMTIWPEAPFTNETAPRISENDLINAIKHIRAICSKEPSCMSFALTALLTLASPNAENVSSFLPFIATPTTAWQEFAKQYTSISGKPLLTRSYPYRTMFGHMEALLESGYALQLSLPPSTKLLTAKREWGITSSAHIISILMLDNRRIVVLDNMGCVRYEIDDIEEMLESRPNPRDKLERLWDTTLQGGLIRHHIQNTPQND